MKFIFLISYLVLAFASHAQTPVDSILIEETLNGFNFYYHDQPIKTKQVAEIMEINFDAYDEFESGREALVFGNVFCIMGNALIAIPFITSVIGEDTNWGLAIAGTGFIGISLPIFKTYNKKTLNAVNIYNMGNPLPPLIEPQSSLGFGATRHGIGFAYTF